MLFTFFFFFFKQKTAYEIYQCDWSSDVCSSDLLPGMESERPAPTEPDSGDADTTGAEVDGERIDRAIEEWGDQLDAAGGSRRWTDAELDEWFEGPFGGRRAFKRRFDYDLYGVPVAARDLLLRGLSRSRTTSTRAPLCVWSSNRSEEHTSELQSH